MRSLLTRALSAGLSLAPGRAVSAIAAGPDLDAQAFLAKQLPEFDDRRVDLGAALFPALAVERVAFDRLALAPVPPQLARFDDRHLPHRALGIFDGDRFARPAIGRVEGREAAQNADAVAAVHHRVAQPQRDRERVGPGDARQHMLPLRARAQQIGCGKQGHVVAHRAAVERQGGERKRRVRLHRFVERVEPWRLRRL